MPDQNQPKAPAFNPKLKDAIVALKAENNPKNLNAVLNELVRSPLLAPANFDLQGQSAPTPGPDGRVQLPPNTKINLIMVNSPEGKHYYLGFSDWDAVHAWQKNPEQGRQVIMLRFDDFANMVSKNPDASGIVINPGENSLRLEIMIINDEAKSYLLVLDGPKDDKLFSAVAKAARPYLMGREKKIDLNITTSISPLGQQGMRGSEPFYRKGIGRIMDEDDDE